MNEYINNTGCELGCDELSVLINGSLSSKFVKHWYTWYSVIEIRAINALLCPFVEASLRPVWCCPIGSQCCAVATVTSSGRWSAALRDLWVTGSPLCTPKASPHMRIHKIIEKFIVTLPLCRPELFIFAPFVTYYAALYSVFNIQYSIIFDIIFNSQHFPSWNFLCCRWLKCGI